MLILERHQKKATKIVEEKCLKTEKAKSPGISINRAIWLMLNESILYI